MDAPDADGPDPDRPEDTAAGETRAPLTQQLGRVVVLVALLLFVVFALDNAQHVDFSWIVGGTEVRSAAGERTEGGVRLIVLLVGAFAIGAAVGGTAIATRHRASRRADRRR